LPKTLLPIDKYKIPPLLQNNRYHIKSGGIEINITHSQETAPWRFPKINRAIVTSGAGAPDYFGVGKRHGAVSRVAVFQQTVNSQQSTIISMSATGIELSL
jgi:hypothetical protein